MAEPPISIAELMDTLYGWFRGPSWDAWRALGASLFGVPLTPEQLATYQKHTGRTTAPTAQAREAYVVARRRARADRRDLWPRILARALSGE